MEENVMNRNPEEKIARQRLSVLESLRVSFPEACFERGAGVIMRHEPVSSQEP